MMVSKTGGIKMFINFKHEHKCFNLRVASVIKKDEKILLARDMDFYTLPGGRVFFGETTEAALKRVLLEELNVIVKIIKLLSINENFFDYEEDQYHELLFVYLCEIETENNEEIKEDFVSHKQKSYNYISTKELMNVNFKPGFLLGDLKNMTNDILHNVNK